MVLPHIIYTTNCTALKNKRKSNDAIHYGCKVRTSLVFVFSLFCNYIGLYYNILAFTFCYVFVSPLLQVLQSIIETIF